MYRLATTSTGVFIDDAQYEIGYDYNTSTWVDIGSGEPNVLSISGTTVSGTHNDGTTFTFTNPY